MEKPRDKLEGPTPSATQSEEFDQFFGNRRASRQVAMGLVEELKFAGETDRESGIFAQPAAPAPSVSPPPPTPRHSLAHVEARRAVNHAKDARGVTDAFLAYGKSLFSRVALFVSKAPRLDGWDAAGGSWNRQMIEKVRVPLGEPSVFRLFQSSGGYYLGPIPKTPANDAFVRATGGERPKSCLIVPVLVGQRVVNVFYGDNGHASEVSGEFSELLLFVLTVGQAYESMIRSGQAPGRA